MVCLPCFVIPALLFLFRMVIQPLVYRFWGRRIQEPALSCPMPQKKKNLNKSDDNQTPATSNSEIDANSEIDPNACNSSKKDN